MPRECECSGGCSQATSRLSEVTRREFLQALGVGAVAAWGGQGLHAANTLTSPASGPRPPGSPPAGERFGAYPLTPPRVYAGDHLRAVATPIGGIGTGTVWLDGQGRLRVWQIFNNDTEVRVPNSFLGMRVAVEGEQPQLRVLQTEAEAGFPACSSLTLEGGYPVVRLEFDTGLPVTVRLEAFNPMIPTDTDNSSLPCVVFRLTARNQGDRPAEVALLAALANAAGYDGRGDLSDMRHPNFGGNRNIVVRERGLTAVNMTLSGEPPWHGFIRARDRNGAEMHCGPMLWLSGLDDPAVMARQGAAGVSALEAMSRLADQEAVVVCSGATSAFFDALRRAANLTDEHLEVFEDFEGETYEGWSVAGEAFGGGPARGTQPGQQPVSGFYGKGLVNTFRPNDRPQGRLLSRPFRIERRYIGFLIGGGKHAETCVNLRVRGKVVRTARGRNRERLEPVSWDVGQFADREAQLEIVDAHSGGWGHINVDHIVFSDIEPQALLRLSGAFQRLSGALDLQFTAARQKALAQPVAIDLPGGSRWKLDAVVQLADLKLSGEVRVLARTPDGDPLLLQLPYGKATLVLPLATGMPWSWARQQLCRVNGLDSRSVHFETTRPGFGSICLLVSQSEAGALPEWTDSEELARMFAADPSFANAPKESELSAAGRTHCAALSTPFSLAPGAERAVTFAFTWHFPNVERYGHQGNHYCTVFADALDAAHYLGGHLDDLTARTLLYQQTLYASNLPEEFLDAASSQSVIIRSPVCWRSAEGYFAGFEGAYHCCPLNCTHVWNYAQTHARLFPDLGRNMRVSNFITYLHDDGETSHREHAPNRAFADGHCACIEAALREHQMSADDKFLRTIYPGVKKAMEWFIGKYDPEESGLTRGQQWNTYDTAVSGRNTFIGSQYLAALAAAESMARVMGDEQAAQRWQTIRRRGMTRQNEELWNGEHYIQIPDQPPGRDYNNGCHSDQLLGQWWAHQLGLGYLYPQNRVKETCRAIFRHNFRPDFTGLPQIPRRYVDDGDGGLYMCTWPRGDRPEPFILYAIEVWTGIEYAAAGLMVHEGLFDEARTIVATARARYDGRPRQKLNSGGGVCGAGNPFQELECGKFYARAQSSWSLIIACQGLVLDGPAGVLGFKPTWQPEDHRSFFTTPEGWGLFVQRRAAGSQTARIELRHGRARLRELVFTTPFTGDAVVRHNNRAVSATPRRQPDGETHLALAQPLQLREGDVVETQFSA